MHSYFGFKFLDDKKRNFLGKLPYWLKGGIIGGVFALVFIILFFSCIYLTGFSSNDYEVLSCGIFLIFGPIQFTLWLLNILNSILNTDPMSSSNIFPLEILIPMTILISFILGSFLGIIIDLIKSKKRLP